MTVPSDHNNKSRIKKHLAQRREWKVLGLSPSAGREGGSWATPHAAWSPLPPQLSQGTGRWEGCRPSRWSKSQEGGTQQEASTVRPRVQGHGQSQNTEPQRAFLDASNDQEINWGRSPARGRKTSPSASHSSQRPENHETPRNGTSGLQVDEAGGVPG